MLKSFVQISKSVCIALITSLALSLIFAVIIKLFSLPSSCIVPVVIVFKITSVLLGVLVAVREEKGLLKGAISGAMAVVVTFFVFSLLAGTFSFGWKLLVEVIIGAFCGSISGVIAVNIKK